MTVKVTMTNNSSDSVDFINATGTTLAQVKAADGGSSNGSLALHTTSAGTSSERVRVDTSGNVGIGTSSPAEKCHIYASSGNAFYKFQNAATGSGASDGGFVGIGGSGDVFLYNYEASNLIFSTNNAERARIDSSGNWLVGATSASGKFTLSVGSGQVGYYTNKSSGGGGLDHAQYYTDGTLQGKITQTGGFTTVSDYRLKSDVVPLSGMLEKICKLRPVSYTLTAFSEQQFGFIAHELQEELPIFVNGEKDAVNEDGSIAPQSVDYPKLVSVLTAAIQEQQALIQTLTSRIEALENK